MYSYVRKLAFLLFCFGAGVAAPAQSTFGSINGNVHDSTGAVVPGASISVERLESNTGRTVSSAGNGDYAVLNLEAGSYTVQVSAPGFATELNQHVLLDTRQQLRLDITLRAASNVETVQVNASDAGTIDTENAEISAALSAKEVEDLPANYRGAGSTSPLNVIQALPGVQPDSGSFPPTPSASPQPNVKFSIQGGLPSQSETTVDGISAQNQTTNNIQADAFPSAESIQEIRVDGVNTNAEYGQPGEITTVSKSGTNQLHGSAFWYFQNSAFDATPYGSVNKPKKVANDFGVSVGGPVVFPHYNGRNKTFFFATYEALRYPLATLQQETVPTVLMKQGNFSQETTALVDPFTPIGANGTRQDYPDATLPAISASSAAFLSLFPDPNVGQPGMSLSATLAKYGYNYEVLRRNDIDSNQFDARIDQNFGQKATLFGRYTWKNIDQLQPEVLLIPDGDGDARYRILASAFNYTFTPSLLNETRFGFTLEQDGSTDPLNGRAITDSAGFQGLPAVFPFNGLTHIGFNTLTSFGNRYNGQQQSKLFQYVDNVTWQHGSHSVRVGGDIRQLTANTVLSFAPADNQGNFYFSDQSGFTGQEFADFLLGLPYLSQTDNVLHDNHATANTYAFYAQDNWKATPNLTLNYGLRYDFHPAFSTTDVAIGNFDPSVPKSGRVLFNQGQVSTLDPEELANFDACETPGVNNPFANNEPANGAPCTPVVSNTQAGVPAGLRTAPKLRFQPRFGFAWRVFGNDKTVVRGGVGLYNVTTSGAIFYALTGTVNANLQYFNNSDSAAGVPTFQFPNARPAQSQFVPSLGSVYFYSAVDVNWHDPYSIQDDLTVERDLGHGFGLRVSYIGLKTDHLVWQPDYNMLQLSATRTAASVPRSAFPFPNFSGIEDRSPEAQANYNAGQVELAHNYRSGYSFNTNYTYAKNLSDDQGTYGASAQAASFVDEQGGYDGTWTGNRHLDYGDVTGTRHHRWLTTGVAQLPVGRGQKFAGNVSKPVDYVIGGWQLSSIFVLQSGPYLTPAVPGGEIDPSGTGSGTLFYRAQRPDLNGHGNFSGHSRDQWFNTSAFSCPGETGFATLQNGNCVVGSGTNPIGRFGTESIGAVTGPGTVSLSSGLAKAFPITDRVRLRAEGTFSNILNHTNLADPLLDLTNPAFGKITQARGSDFGGNRTGQVSMRLEF